MPTDFAALDALYPLPPSELYNQWLLTAESTRIPEGWKHQSLEGWHLGFHESTFVCQLSARDGTQLGWVIAPLVYLRESDSVFPKRELELPVEADASASEVERALYGRDQKGLSDGGGLQGMWMAVIMGGADGERYQRVYLGPTNSIVFSPDHRTVATTPNLMPALERDLALCLAVDPLEKNTYYPFGLTAFKGVERLMPNHYLDLPTFAAHRHWPPPRLPRLEEGKAGAAAIVENGRRIVTALSENRDAFHVFLSAGRDSRSILAIARRLIELGKGPSLSTNYGKDIPSRTDLQAGRRVAKIAGLPHEAARRRTPPMADRMQTFAIIGEARAGKVLSWPRKPQNLALGNRFMLGGMAGELGRAYYWSKTPLPDGELTAEDLVKRIGTPQDPKVVAAAQKWLDELPLQARENPADALDLAYVEQRLGCWEAPIKFRRVVGGPPNAFSPMTTAFSIEMMLRLPLEYRAKGHLQRDMVAYGWPELLEVPFNEPAGLLKFQNLADRARKKALRISRDRLKRKRVG